LQSDLATLREMHSGNCRDSGCNAFALWHVMTPHQELAAAALTA